MAFNSLFKLLLELSNQASWARFNFRDEFETTAAGLWRVPGRSFLVKTRFKFT